jgi:hypothetical protein
MNQAISRALADEMERDERVVLMGEDVAEAEGVFTTSEGAGLADRGELGGRALGELRGADTSRLDAVQRLVLASPAADPARMFANVLAPASR